LGAEELEYYRDSFAYSCRFQISWLCMIECIIQNKDAEGKVLLLCTIAIPYKLWRLHYWKTSALVNMCLARPYGKLGTYQPITSSNTHHSPTNLFFIEHKKNVQHMKK
jgi:hypothetical protein